MLSPLSGGDVAGAGDHGGGSSGYGSDRSQHHDLRAALRKIINKEINPFVNNWEEEGQFLAQEVFKTLGQAGSLGVEYWITRAILEAELWLAEEVLIRLEVFDELV